MSDAAVMAMIALVGSVVGLVVQLFSKKHQLQYDVKLAVLEDRQKRCEQDGIAKDKKIAALESRVLDLSVADVRDKAELEAKITTIATNKADGNSGDSGLSVIK